MVEAPGLPATERPAPGRVADWKVTFHAETPDVAQTVLAALGIGALDVGAAVTGALAGVLVDSALPPHFRSVSRDDYYGTLEIDGQAGLSGTGFTMELERVTREDYEALARVLEICTAAQVSLVAEVMLGWSGANWLGLIPLRKDMTPEGLYYAGRFVISDVTAQVDGLQLRMKVTGRDFITHRLSETRITDAAPASDVTAAARAVLEQAGLDGFIEPAGLPIPIDLPLGGGGDDDAAVSLELGKGALDQLRDLSRRMQEEANKWGRDAVLLRGTKIYLGTDRAIPPADAPIRELTTAGGLLSCQMVERRAKDPSFAFAEGDTAARPPMRRVFRVEMIGAADLQVGDVVRVTPNPGDSIETGALATIAAAVSAPAADVALYVSAISHRIGKNQGFKTTLTGIQINPDSSAPDAIWDVHTLGPQSDGPPVDAALSDGTPEGELARNILNLVGEQLQRVAWPTVAEIRNHEIDAFISRVIRGVRVDQSGSNMVNYGEMYRTGQGSAENVPYATPFAWGLFGQVLPRYPGMRVILDHRGGSARDPVDIGAVWPLTNGENTGGPLSAQQGDWWLSLPAGVSETYGSDVDVSEPVLPPQDAKSANDLTDRDGNRTIEVGQFIIRVGAAALGDAGARPAAAGDAEEQAVVIEQKDSGAKIVLDKDGNISFTGRRISFEAETVDIAVSDAMNVTKP